MGRYGEVWGEIALPKVIENAPATPAPAAVSSESRSEFGAGLHRFRGERGTRMATHSTTYTPAGMASARKGAPENCSCTSGSGSVFSGDGPTRRANVFGAPREDEGCGRPKVRRSTVECSGLRVLSSAGWEYKNTCFPSRSPAKHRAEDNAGDSDEQRLGGEGSEKGQERPRPGVPTTARSASHSR